MMLIDKLKRKHLDKLLQERDKYPSLVQAILDDLNTKNGVGDITLTSCMSLKNILSESIDENSLYIFISNLFND